MMIFLSAVLFVLWVLYGALMWRRVASWCRRFDRRSFGFRFALMGFALIGSMLVMIGGFFVVWARDGETFGWAEFAVFLPTGILFVHLQMVAAGLMWRLGCETGSQASASEEEDGA